MTTSDTTQHITPEQLTEDDRNLLHCVRDHFAAVVGPDGGEGVQLFTVDAPDLWELFLNTIPQELRQTYTCTACRHFVQRFGDLVTIDSSGVTHSAMFGEGPGVFAPVIAALAKRVEHARITGVFLSREPRYGTPVTGPWNHFAVTPPPKMVYRDRGKSANERAAELREEYGILRRSLAEYPIEVVQNAHTLLTSGQLYRSEKCIGVATWFLSVHQQLAAREGRAEKEALTWRLAVSAPAGYCHVRTTVISTLLDNIVAGKSFDEIKAAFDSAMAPSRYQRSTAAPARANVEQAEEIVAKLGIASSLQRRFAKIDDVPVRAFLWAPRMDAHPSKVAEPKAPQTAGVFGNVKTKDAEEKAIPKTVEANATVMTWDKFQRTILPNVVKLEAMVPTSSDRFAALVTAADLEAPPILQWDREDQRNPVSWYYAAGIDAEIRQRVTGAGGQIENVDIRASLLWNNRNDLDIHCITPYGDHIHFAAKQGRCMGWLDVDMNVRGETDKPVENIRWARGRAPNGRYRFYVNNYAFHEHRHTATPFRVELEVGGQVFHYDAVMPVSSGPNATIQVADFTYQDGKLVTMHASLRPTHAGGVTSWNLTTGEWAPVKAIAVSPNMWGDKPMPQHGEHVFFLLDGCRDTEQGIGRGFFTETLRSELRSVRATLESFTASTPIAGAEEATACGLGMAKGSPWDIVLRTTTAAGATGTYKLDRWD